MEQSRIDRISELTRISRTRELTPEEQAERKELRTEYVNAFKQSLQAQLDNTYVIGTDGIKRKLTKKD